MDWSVAPPRRPAADLVRPRRAPRGFPPRTPLRIASSAPAPAPAGRPCAVAAATPPAPGRATQQRAHDGLLTTVVAVRRKSTRPNPCSAANACWTSTTPWSPVLLHRGGDRRADAGGGRRRALRRPRGPTCMRVVAPPARVLPARASWRARAASRRTPLVPAAGHTLGLGVRGTASTPDGARWAHLRDANRRLEQNQASVPEDRRRRGIYNAGPGGGGLRGDARRKRKSSARSAPSRTRPEAVADAAHFLELAARADPESRALYEWRDPYGRRRRGARALCDLDPGGGSDTLLDAPAT